MTLLGIKVRMPIPRITQTTKVTPTNAPKIDRNLRFLEDLLTTFNFMWNLAISLHYATMSQVIGQAVHNRLELRKGWQGVKALKNTFPLNLSPTTN